MGMDARQNGILIAQPGTILYTMIEGGPEEEKRKGHVVKKGTDAAIFTACLNVTLMVNIISL